MCYSVTLKVFIRISNESWPSNAQSISCQLRTRNFPYKRMGTSLPNTVVKKVLQTSVSSAHTKREDLLHHQRYQ